MCIRWRWWSNLSNPDCDAMRNDKNAKHAIRAIRAIRRRQVERKCIDKHTWQTLNLTNSFDFFFSFCLIFNLRANLLQIWGFWGPRARSSAPWIWIWRTTRTSRTRRPRIEKAPVASPVPLPWKLMAVFFSSWLMAWPKFVQLFSWRFGRSKHSYQLLLDSETSCMTNSWQADFFPKQQLFDVLIDVWCLMFLGGLGLVLFLRSFGSDVTRRRMSPVADADW